MVTTGPNADLPAYEKPQVATRPKARTSSALRRTDKAVADLYAYFRGGDFNPDDPLPPESELCERFNLTTYTLRQAFARLRGRGVIVTVNGKGSFLAHPNQRPVITRDPADPFRDLTPVGTRNDGLIRADLLTAVDFGIRAGDRTYVSNQRYRHAVTGQLVYYVRTLPLSAVYDIEPEPDAFGDRATLLITLAVHYGKLQTHTRYRVITYVDAELATELALDPGAPVIEHRRLIQTARGRLLMTENETTQVTPYDIEQL